MRLRFLGLILLLCAGCSEAPKSEPPAPAPAPAAPVSQIHGDLRQVMRGILFPSSNVVFAAQDKLNVKEAPDPSTATDPLASTYGGWQAVENAGISLAESANLLTVPGRKCANGRDVPINNDDWKKYVQELRDAGMASYKAAQTKNPDEVVIAAGALIESCSHCHDAYREKPAGEKDRCM
jgi:hypothetical protein